MKRTPIAIVGIGYLSLSAALAADTSEKPASPEATSITNQAAEYEKAYNAGDAKGLARFFTDDVEYIDENGQLTEGRSDIEQLLTETFAENRGATLDKNES